MSGSSDLLSFDVGSSRSKRKSTPTVDSDRALSSSRPSHRRSSKRRRRTAGADQRFFNNFEQLTAQIEEEEQQQEEEEEEEEEQQGGQQETTEVEMELEMQVDVAPTTLVSACATHTHQPLSSGLDADPILHPGGAPVSDLRTVIDSASDMPALDDPTRTSHDIPLVSTAASLAGLSPPSPPAATLHAIDAANIMPPLEHPLAHITSGVNQINQFTQLIPSSLPPLPRARTSIARTASPPRPHPSSSRSATNSPVQPQPTPPVDPLHMFAGMRMVLLQGPELTSKRCDLLTTQIIRRGGHAVSVGEIELPARLKGITHILFGSAGDIDGRVRAYANLLESHLKARQFASLIFSSVEWVTSCLRKNAIASLHRFRVSMHGQTQPNECEQGAYSNMAADTLSMRDQQQSHRTGVTRDMNFVAPPSHAGFGDFDANAPPAMINKDDTSIIATPYNDLVAIAPHAKRDIRYVLDSMQHQSTPPAPSSIAPSVPAHSSASSVKVESMPNTILDAATLRRAKQENKDRRAANRTHAYSTQAAAPSAPSAPYEAALAASYTQPVPTFSAVVPYDQRQHLPKTTGSSYLNPGVRVEGASFLHSGKEEHPQSAFTDATQPSPLHSPSPSPMLVSGHHPLPAAQNAGAWLERNKAHLACQMFSSQHKNLNSHITNILEQLEGMNGSIGDKWRTYAYRKAVGILKKYPSRISTQSDILQLAGVRGLGTKILKKISEIVSTGDLQKVHRMAENQQVKTMALFSKIHGVGPNTAQKWYTWGLRSVEQLLTDTRVQLSDVQKVGLQFMDDKAQRIPRLEVTSILDYVHRLANRLLPGVTVICCGSFRRGAPTSGDVDLLFTHPTFTCRDMKNSIDDPISVSQREGFLKKLLALLHQPVLEGSERWNEEKAWSEAKYSNVKQECERIKREVEQEKRAQQERELTPNSNPSLESQPPVGEPTAAAAASSSSAAPIHPSLRPPDKKSFLTGDLSSFDKLSSRHGSAYYMGFCSLPKFHPFHSGISRRIDMKVYPANHFPFALLYFTGSDHFNRCWGAGTRLLMYDGSTKSVETIVAGDRLMGPDSLPRTVIQGSIVHGNTAMDHIKRKIQAELSKSNGQQHDSNCVVTPPAAQTYEIRSLTRGRQTFTCNEQHVLVLQWHDGPTLTFDSDHGRSRLIVYRLQRDAAGVPRVSMSVVSFHQTAAGRHSKQARRAYRRASAAWLPIEWEVSVADFMTYPTHIRSACKMFAPLGGVQFPPPPDSVDQPRSLTARLTAIMRDMELLANDDRPSSEFVRMTAWLIGMWLTDGDDRPELITQMHNRPSRSHTPVIRRIEHWFELAYGVRAGDGVRDALLLYRHFLGRNPASTHQSCTESNERNENDVEDDIDKGDDSHCEYTSHVDTDFGSALVDRLRHAMDHLNEDTHSDITKVPPPLSADRAYVASDAGNPSDKMNTASLIRRIIESYHMIGQQHIPSDLMRESKSIRTSLLAGMIDGGGWYTRTDAAFVVCGARAYLEQVQFLARSIGHSVDGVREPNTTSGSHTIQIGGAAIDEINTQLALAYKHALERPLHMHSTDLVHAVGFTCTAVAHADYYGFQVAGANSQLLTADFMVTHNSMRYFAKKKVRGTHDRQHTKVCVCVCVCVVDSFSLLSSLRSPLKMWTLSDHGLSPAIRINGSQQQSTRKRRADHSGYILTR